jgi:hypothetical protein
MSSTAECTFGRATNEPARRRRVTRPASARAEIALLTVILEQPYCSVSSCSNGIR